MRKLFTILLFGLMSSFVQSQVCQIIASDSAVCQGFPVTLSVTDSFFTCSPFPYNRFVGSEIFVSPTGNDITGDGSLGNPYGTIQKGVTVSTNGDRVTLLDGIYTGTGNRDISLHGKQIVVQSYSGPNCCIIDAERQGRCFMANSGETMNTWIRGIKMINGMPSTPAYGSGIFCEDNSGIRVTCCIFENDTLGAMQLGDNESVGPESRIDTTIFYNNPGYCISSSKKSFIMNYCLFQDNYIATTGEFVGNGHASSPYYGYYNCVWRRNYSGGGILGLGHTKECKNSFFIENTGLTWGIIYMGTVWSDKDHVDHCTFYNNTGVGYNSGWFDHIGDVKSSIFYGLSGLNTISGNQGSIPYTYCDGDVPAGTGNINQDPLFANPANNDFTLLPGSPCLGTGESGTNMGADPNGIPSWLWEYQPASTYQWSTGGTTDVIIDTPMVTTTYYVTVTNLSGSCNDSIQITVIPPENSVVDVSICEDTTYYFNGQNLSSPGTYYDTLQTFYGCDSVIALNLDVLYHTYDTVTVVECDSYRFNGITYDSTGIYLQSLPNFAGCDSILTLDLTINYYTTDTIVDTACFSYSANGYTYYNSGIHSQTLLNSVNCDSILILELYIKTIDTTVNVDQVTLTSNETGAYYQWVDCNLSYSPLIGDTNQVYSASTNGDYAVIIDKNGCTDTTICYNIFSVGINNADNNQDILFYPNPVDNEITIKTASCMTNAQYYIADRLGNIVVSGYIEEGTTVVSVDDLSAGVYFLNIESSIVKYSYKLIKN